MWMYLLRRLLFALLLVFAVSSASLLLTRLAPGDYATEALGDRRRRLARVSFDAAAPDVALPRLSRGAHRLAADRRHRLGRSPRHDAPPDRAGDGARSAAGRDVRAAAGAGDARRHRCAVR